MASTSKVVSRAPAGTIRSVAHGSMAGTRKAWLAALGSYALARKAVAKAAETAVDTREAIVNAVVPRYEALVDEGRAVERGLLKKTGAFVERGIAVGTSALDVARSTVRESAHSAMQKTGIEPRRRARPRRTPVDSLIRRIDTLETEIRSAPAPR